MSVDWVRGARCGPAFLSPRCRHQRMGCLGKKRKAKDTCKYREWWLGNSMLGSQLCQCLSATHKLYLSPNRFGSKVDSEVGSWFVFDGPVVDGAVIKTALELTN